MGRKPEVGFDDTGPPWFEEGDEYYDSWTLLSETSIATWYETYLPGLAWELKYTYDVEIDAFATHYGLELD